MNLKVEWANNPTTFAEVEDWNAVTLKHLNPKKRKDLQHIIDCFCGEYNVIEVSEGTIIADTLIGEEYILAKQYISSIEDYIVFLIQSNQFGTRVIRIADWIIKI